MTQKLYFLSAQCMKGHSSYDYNSQKLEEIQMLIDRLDKWCILCQWETNTS